MYGYIFPIELLFSQLTDLVIIMNEEDHNNESKDFRFKVFFYQELVSIQKNYLPRVSLKKSIDLY